MAQPSNKKSLLFILSALLLITSTTYLVSILARGYKIGFNQTPFIKVTGLLSATSVPKSASVYINDRLTTATDDTINLPPNSYHIKIIKDGYLPWQKTIEIKKETVFQTEAQLFRSAPDLSPLTLTGAINPIISPDNSKIVYAVASASATINNGLYQLDLINRPLPLSKNLPKQIYPDFANINWAEYVFEFSPDSRSVLATNQKKSSTYLINLETPPNRNNLFDITSRLPLIKQEWQHLTTQLVHNKIKNLPPEIKEVVSTASAQNISFSPGDDKVFYLADKDSQLNDSYITPPPAQSTQKQDRQIKSQHYYIYDLKDDTNFLLGHQDNISHPFWLPGSNNIVYVQGDQIKTTEYDTTNTQTLFANNFDPNVVYPWPNGSRIITLTSAYTGSQKNLYAISIR